MKIITDKIIKMDLRSLKANGFTFGNNIKGMLYNALYFSTHTDSILLRYRQNDESIYWKIKIHWKQCNYGGNRAYLICPCCKQRVLTLFFDSKEFKCRKCGNFCYKSQTESKLERILNKSRKLRKKLTSSSTFSGVIWNKPKGMHHKTFYRLVDMNFKIMRQYKDTILEEYRGDA